MKTKIVAIDREHLHYLVKLEIDLNGYNFDLNHIDVSNITSMSGLFAGSKFNGDISQWDVSKVENMIQMFYDSEFNQDLTQWKPEKLKDKVLIFQNCPAPIPYWAEAENTPEAVKSYWLNKGLEEKIIDKSFKSNRIKI